MIRNSIKKRIKHYQEVIVSAKDDLVGMTLMTDYKRWLCQNDLFFLCLMTGNDKIAGLKEIYRPFCDTISLMNWKVIQLGMHPPSENMLRIEDVVDSPDQLLLERLFLCYRTFYKTTIVTKVHSTQLLLNFPNIHILFAHNKESNASANLVAVKNFFLTTPEYGEETLKIFREDYCITDPKSLSYLFPECLPDTKEWGNMTAFSLANRTDWGRDEHSIMAVGVDTEITGGHWQVAKKNDLVTEKSVNTDEQRKKTSDWDERFNLGHFDDPQIPLQDYEGTRYHFTDLYSSLKDKINFRKIPILKNVEKFRQGDDSQIVHPDRFTREGISKLMEDMWVFNCQMMLEPDDPARMQFHPGMIRYFDSIPSGCLNVTLVDPASARKKKSDYTAILNIDIIKKDGKVLKFIKDGIRDKLNPTQRIDAVIEMCKRWNSKELAWEAIAFQDTDCFNYEERRRKEGTPHATTIKSHSASKEDRIRGLVPQYANGEWLWPEKGKIVRKSLFDGKAYDLTEELESELMDFPLGQHDDLIDVQTFLDRLDISKPEFKEQEEESEDMTFADYKGMMNDKRNKTPWEKVHTASYV